MAIDIRATVTCSLGTLISGSLSDDYIQGSGLVKTRGSVEISALITPAIGTAVTFSYTKGGVTRSIPRKLRVLSSFADPFRRTTKVELGCKLTYLSDLKPAPSVDGDVEAETGKRRECLNGYIDYDKDTEFGIPLAAKDLAEECLSKLDITPQSSIPLTSKFYRESFDLTSGYVNVLSDLLLSESYCGYLNEQEQLVVLDLSEESGIGRVYTKNDIVDLSSINTGGLPGDAVVVRYESVELKEDLENADPEVINQRNWTEDETIGEKQTVYVRYLGANGINYTNTYTYLPYTKTASEYGQDDSWNDTTCVLIDTNGEGADLSNTVVKRTTRRNVLKAEAANDFCAQLLSEGIDPGAGLEAEVIVTEEYEYDSDGQLTRQTTTTEEPFFAWAGRLGLEYVYDNPGVQSRVAVFLGATPLVTTSKVVVDVTTLYADLPRTIKLNPGETYKRVVNGQKTVTKTYQNWGLSQQGEQGTAGIRVTSPFANVEECTQYLYAIKDSLALVDTTIQTTRDRVLIGIERRPPVELRMGDQNGARGEFTTQLLYAAGSPTKKRIIEFSLPYAPDDTRSSSGALVKGNAKAIANRFGRVQNRLLFGNRNGINLQLAPEKLPLAPFALMYVQASGLTALYRANGNQWAFSSDGIVCSTDALFWAAVGGTGVFWFPVAPGITTLPPEPPIVDGEMNATSTVRPYNEIAVYDSRLRVTSVINKFDYALGLLTVVPPTPITVFNLAKKILLIKPSSVQTALQAQTPIVSGGGSIKVLNTNIEAVFSAPIVASGSSVGAPAAGFTIAGLAPSQVGRPRIEITVDSVSLAVNAMPPVVSTGVSLAIPASINVSTVAHVAILSRTTPSYAETGSGTSGTNQFTVFWPPHQTNDIGFVVIEGSGGDTTLTPPSGWAAVTGSPVVDVADANGSKLQVWWKRATSASELAIGIADGGDHQISNIFTIRNCVTSGDPWDVITTGTKTTASTTATIPSVTTNKFNTLIVMIVGRPNDVSGDRFGTPVNSNLTSLVKRYEFGGTSGNGGGYAVCTGVMALKDNTGETTISKTDSTTDTYVVMALRSY